MSCQHCIDPDGTPSLPQYGKAPHEFFYKIPGAAIGQSRQLPTEQWPDNFVPDPDAAGFGTWYCEHCREGLDDARKEQSS